MTATSKSPDELLKNAIWHQNFEVNLQSIDLIEHMMSKQHEKSPICEYIPDGIINDRPENLSPLLERYKRAQKQLAVALDRNRAQRERNAFQALSLEGGFMVDTPNPDRWREEQKSAESFMKSEKASNAQLVNLAWNNLRKVVQEVMEDTSRLYKEWVDAKFEAEARQILPRSCGGWAE